MSVPYCNVQLPKVSIFQAFSMSSSVQTSMLPCDPWALKRELALYTRTSTGPRSLRMRSNASRILSVSETSQAYALAASSWPASSEVYVVVLERRASAYPSWNKGKMSKGFLTRKVH